MQEFAAGVGPWAVVVVCVVVAVVMPVSASRQLTPDVLREAYVLNKPGRVIAVAVVLLAMLSVAGAVIALIAMAYPSFWAVEATLLSGAAVVVMYIVRYRAAARAYDGSAPEADGDHDSMGA